jgi:hypothetical protein
MGEGEVRGPADLCLAVIAAYLNSLDTNYTSGNNIYIPSRGQTRSETVSVSSLPAKDGKWRRG